MRLLVKIGTYAGRNTPLPEALTEIDHRLWARLQFLLMDHRYTAYVVPGPDGLVCRLHIDADVAELTTAIPELLRPWLELVRTPLLGTLPGNAEVYTTVMVIDDDYLMKSGYFRTLLEGTTENSVVPLPTEYDVDVYSYLFGKLPTLPAHRLVILDQFYSATKYYDLRFDDLMTELQKIADVAYPSLGDEDGGNDKFFLVDDDDNFLLHALDIESRHPTRISLQKYIDKLCFADPTRVKNFHDRFETTRRALRPHLIRNRFQLGRSVNIDFLLPTLYGPGDTVQSPRRVATTIAEFLAEYRRLSFGLFPPSPQFNWRNKVLAGGFPLECLYLGKLNEHTDMDFFVYGSSAERETAIRDILWALPRRELYLTSKGSVIYIWITDVKRMVQIINADYSNMTQILEGFDHTCCQVLFNGTDVICSDGFRRAVTTSKTECRLFKPERLHKMMAKGFDYEGTDEERDSVKHFVGSGRAEATANRYYYPTSQVSRSRNTFLLRLVHSLGPVCEDVKTLLADFDFRRVLNRYNPASDVDILPVVDDGVTMFRRGVYAFE